MRNSHPPPDYGQYDSDEERKRKGKSPVDDEGDSASEGFSKDSDYSFNHEDSGSDDRLYESYIDREAEWVVEDDPIGVVEKRKNGVGEDENKVSGDADQYFGEDNLLESDDDFHSVRSEDDEEDLGEKVPVYSDKKKYQPVFLLGMVFRTKQEFKELVDSHAILENRPVIFSKSDKTRVYAKCSDKDCPFKIHLRKKVDDNTFEITTLFGDHTCVPSYYVRNMNSNWLCGRYGYDFNDDKKRSVEGFRKLVVKEVRCNVTWWQAYRSKRLALKAQHGNAEEQYALLWSYANEIRRSNPESTVKLGVEQVGSENKFARFYLCLSALKKGFLTACRPLFGIDGTFLKGPYGGILLAAVGIDPNNNLYPIAWGVVNKETGDNWEWFMRNLKADLDIYNEYEWTIVSDKQKGLVKAVVEVFPNAAHRFCVSHMHSNMVNAGYRGQIIKTALWKAAKATTVREFGRRMDDIKKLNPGAYDWLKDKHPSQWSRSHFSTYPRCDVLLNNMCESFNAKILPAREMPILSMLEKIMTEMMDRMRLCRELGERWKGPYCPRIQKIIDFNYSRVPDCQPFKSSDDHYQITCYDGTQYAVDLVNGTCGCRKWDLTGIPCKHALCAISSQKLSLDGFVHRNYKVETYREAYSPCIIPINGRDEWPPSEALPPRPPRIVRQAGRPPKARRKEHDEQIVKTRKRQRGRPTVQRDEHHKRRNQTTLSCSTCGRIGHNKRSCQRIHDQEAAQGVQQQHEAAQGVQQQHEAAQGMQQQHEAAQGVQQQEVAQAVQGMQEQPDAENVNQSAIHVEEEILIQSQLTQATILHDDEFIMDDDDLMAIDELISQRSTTSMGSLARKAQVGSSVAAPNKLKVREPPTFRPPKKKIGPIVTVRGTKYLVLPK